MKKLLSSLVTGAAVVALNVSAPAQNALPLADGGQSAYSILLAPDAPESVKIAAADLQQYIQKSTKAKLPLLSQINPPATPFISLGDTAAARAAGVSTQGVALEGYRITTRGKNLFILGPDTPNGQKTRLGGTSNGTSNGVYTFLEDYLNIRWLMPGGMGEDVPALAAVAIPSVDRAEAPLFESRRVTHLQGSPEAMAYERRHKQGSSLLSRHNHNWATIKPELFDTHPEWFAARADGTRIRPDHPRFKLETTNQEMIKYFAEEIKKAFRADPNLYMFSMSPNDGSSDIGAEWSKSPETRALMEKDPLGRDSHTKLILKFYNDIAKIVGQEFPDRKVSGYVYSSYLYPPKDGIGKLEPNLFLTIAMSPTYGYIGYRPKAQEQWKTLMAAWAKETDQISYYDLPTWLRNHGASITPPAPEIMNFILPNLAKYNIKGTYIYGSEDWSHTGPTNYTLSRMTWNPKLDAREVNQEFYRRGYGEAAAPFMQQLYEMVDASAKTYYMDDPRANFNLSPRYMKEVIGANYPKITELYESAQKAQGAAQNEATAGQKARLAFFGDNLILINRRLRKMGALPEDTASPYYRSEAEVLKMVGRVQPGFGVKLGSNYNPARDEYGPAKEPEKLRTGKPAQSSQPPATGRPDPQPAPGVALPDAI